MRYSEKEEEEEGKRGRGWVVFDLFQRYYKISECSCFNLNPSLHKKRHFQSFCRLPTKWIVTLSYRSCQTQGGFLSFFIIFSFFSLFLRYPFFTLMFLSHTLFIFIGNDINNDYWWGLLLSFILLSNHFVYHSFIPMTFSYVLIRRKYEG